MSRQQLPGFAAPTLLSAFVVALLAPPVLAQENAATRRARADQATARLTALAAQNRGAASPDLLAVAQDRAAAVAAMMDEDPEGVLRVALSTAVRNSLPASVQPLIEQATDVEGDLEVVSEDYDWGSRIRHYVRTARERLELHIAGRSRFSSGDRIRVKGVRLGGDVAADGGGSIIQVTSALPYAFGEQKALWILVNFQDKVQQPWSLSAASDLLLNTVSNFYREN